MPDADDFDVEHFRRLLSGESEKSRPETPAPAKPSSPRPTGKTASKGARKPKPRRKP